MVHSKYLSLLFFVLATAFVVENNFPMADAEEPITYSKHLESLDPDAVSWEEKDKAYWKEVLTKEQFQVCRKSGTERPHTGFYNTYKKEGTYHCSNCGLALFSGETKYDSGTGWPSFYDAISKDAVTLKPDFSLGLPRTEVVCSRCKAHLGHVFKDGPAPTGQRYCMNSICLLHEDHMKQ